MLAFAPTARGKLAVAVPLVTTFVFTGLLAGAAAAERADTAPAREQVGADANRVEGIEVQARADDAAEVIIKASKAAPEFTLFRLASPTRIVVDMQGTEIAGVRAPADLDPKGLVSAVTATQFRGRTGPVGRVVVVLRGDVDFQADKRGDAIVLRARRLEAAQPAEAPALRTAARATSTAPAAAQAATVVELSGDASPVRVAESLVDVAVREQGGGALVALQADGAIEKYEIEEAESPARLVIDVWGVRAGADLVRAGLEKSFPAGIVEKARVGRHAEKTRVVLDMRGALPRYDVAQTDEGLTILFNGERAERKGVVELTDASLEQKGGFWRVRFDVTGPAAVRTVANGPREKVIALDGVRMKQGVGRGLRGGPVAGVQMIADAQKADSVRVALKLDEDVEHSVWQKDGSVFWDVRSKGAPALASVASERAQPAAAPFAVGATMAAREGVTARTYRGKKITIDLMDADIVNVIRLLGDVSGKNVVVSEDVKGQITLKLKNVPWDQALDVILKTKDLGQETRGGIIRVVPQAKLDAEREARLKLQEEREKKLPTTVRLIPVNYAVASELVPQVEKLLSARGKATFDQRTNVIIVEDIRDNLEQAERLVRTLDTQTPQVLIEARMVEASTTFTRNLGIQWGGGLFFSQRGGNPTGLVFPNNVAVTGAADVPQEIVPGILAPNNFAVNLPAQNVNSALGLNLGSIGNFGFVNARLSAAEASGQAKIISSPRVTTLNNKRARITQGVDITIPTVTLNTITVQKITAALELDVTPHVTADGSILMSVKLTNNVPIFEQRTQNIPAVSTKEAETEMLVKDGDTAVIGGIYTRQYGENTQQTPFLGSIPILGWLFKSQNETDNRTEMLVFLTPRIVNRRSATPSGGAL